MKVDCEKGTYIRSVISDIGEKLGGGGMMTSLERSYSGGVDIKDCYTIEEIAEICEQWISCHKCLSHLTEPL